MKTELRKFFPGIESLNFTYEWGSGKKYKFIKAKPVNVGEHNIDLKKLTEAKERGLVSVSDSICSITKAGVSEYLNLLGITTDMYNEIKL